MSKLAAPSRAPAGQSQLRLSRFFAAKRQRTPDCESGADAAPQPPHAPEVVDLVDEMPVAEATPLPTHLAAFAHCRQSEPVPRDRSRQSALQKRVAQLEPPSAAAARSPTSFADAPARKKQKVVYTPLEAQVEAIRKEHPGTLLMVECGYKFRFFGVDAETARKVCHLYTHLDHNFETASIPTHRLMVYVRRLVQAGHRVGVVRQTQTAALKRASADSSSQPFTRRLTDLYTPATLLPDLDQDCPTSFYIMAVERTSEILNPAKLAIVALNLATGDLVYDVFPDHDSSRNELQARLESLGPVEILASQNLDPDTRGSLSRFAESRQPVSRLEQYNQVDPESILSADLRARVGLASSPLAALGKYLKDFNLEAALDGHVAQATWKFSQHDLKMHLDANAIRNFNLLPSGDRSDPSFSSLFSFLNHTRSKPGARLLRKWLVQPLSHPPAIRERLESVQQLSDSLISHDALVTGSMAHLVSILPNLPDFDRGLSAIIYGRASPTDLAVMLRGWSEADAALQQSKRKGFCEKCPILSQILAHVPDVNRTLVTTIGPYFRFLDLTRPSREKQNLTLRDVDSLLVKPDEADKSIIAEELRQLFALQEELGTRESKFDSHLSEIRKVLGQPKLEWKVVAQEEFLVEVAHHDLDKAPASWQRVNQTKAFIRFRTPKTAALLEELCQTREKLNMSRDVAWKLVLKLVGEKAGILRNVARYFETLDCLFSMTQVALLPGYVKPTIVDFGSPCEGAGIELSQARHPVVESLMRGGETFVPNDISLGMSTQRSIVLTGPNMGGKSTFIRTAAVIAIMAQSGSYVPADTARLRPFDSIMSRIGAFDSISRGQSSFQVELSEASHILERATKRTLVIMDELGRGTSTHDGAAIAHGTLRYLVEETRCPTLFVTHYPLLTTLVESTDGLVQSFYMDYVEVDGGVRASDEPPRITFLYRAVQGVAQKSYGLNVAALAQIPGSIIRTAARKAEGLETVTRERLLVSAYLRATRSADERS